MHVVLSDKFLSRTTLAISSIIPYMIGVILHKRWVEKECNPSSNYGLYPPRTLKAIAAAMMSAVVPGFKRLLDSLSS